MILLESRGVKFRVQYPNASGHEVELEGTVAILGRDPSCDLVLNDVKCSRRHAVVEAGPQGLAIRDTGSANGVFLNGKKVDRAPLNDGDVFRLGDVTLTVLPEDMPGTRIQNRASPYYHHLHIVQLMILSRLTGQDAFRAFADRWQAYQTIGTNRLRALAWKSAFKLLYY